MIRFSCKWCGKRYRAPDHCAGRADHCHSCGKPVWVPQQYLHFICGCGKKYRTPVKYAGRTLPCRQCGSPVTAPEMAPKDPPPAPLPAGVVPVPANSPFELDQQPMPRLPDMDDLAYEMLADVPQPYFHADLGDFQLDEPLEIAEEDPAPPPARMPIASPYVARSETPTEPLPPQELPVATPAPMPTPVAAPAPLAPAAFVHRPEEYALEAPSVEQPIPETPKKPEPPKKQKGCRHCGCESAYTVHGRSPVGILLMIAGAAGGVAAASIIQDNWLSVLVTLALFAVAVAGSFMRRWIMVCSKCERRIY